MVHIYVQGDWIYETGTDLHRTVLGLEKNSRCKEGDEAYLEAQKSRHK